MGGSTTPGQVETARQMALQGIPRVVTHIVVDQ